MGEVILSQQFRQSAKGRFGRAIAFVKKIRGGNKVEVFGQGGCSEISAGNSRKKSQKI